MKLAPAILDACAADEVVGGMLLLHGLHPLDLEDRVGKAVEQLRKSLQTSDIDLVGIEEGVARVRIECIDGASPIAVRQQIEEAILAFAPELMTVEIEGWGMADLVDGRVALPSSLKPIEGGGIVDDIDQEHRNSRAELPAHTPGTPKGEELVQRKGREPAGKIAPLIARLATQRVFVRPPTGRSTPECHRCPRHE